MIETAPQDGKFVILEEDARGNYDVARWSSEGRRRQSLVVRRPVSRRKKNRALAEGDSPPVLDTNASA
jgi:hypothetical protein